MREKITDAVLWLTLFGWLCAGLLAFAGLYRTEPELKNPRKIEAIAIGMEKGAITVTQPSTDQPLVATFVRAKHPQQFTDDEWNELEATVRRFVAASNWGLSSPFKYEAISGSPEQVAISFKTDEFKYTNPFANPPIEPTDTAIKSAEGLSKHRKGWRIIGPSFSLFLKPDAVQKVALVEADGSTKEGTTLVAQQFQLHASPGKNSLQLSISPSANAEDVKTSTLRVNLLDAKGQSDAGRRFKSGEYFFWENQAFTIHEVADQSSPPNTVNSSVATLMPDDLVVTKRINGRVARVHVLGQSTTNLIGVRVGGYLPLLDGAIKQQETREVRLTLDPDLQSTAFNLLTSVLKELDARQGIRRRRRGSVAVVDSNNGSILAMVGYPSLDADWIEQRRILIDRDQFVRSSPALEKHMAGSSVKVMTVALGYLMDGKARVELLPPSNNDQAVRQAFQDVYGIALRAPLEGTGTRPTDAARTEFLQVRNNPGMRNGWSQVLWEVFRVLPNLKDQNSQGAKRDEIVRGNLARFFDQNKLRAVFPVTSAWPAEEADSMDMLCLHALGAGEARFTTLRLASILGTAATGKRYEPYLVESVQDQAGTTFKFDQSAVTEPNLLIPDSSRHVISMRQDMTTYLRKVLLPGGTGSFFLDSGAKQFLAQNDPTTQIDEDQTRREDYGKSGTAAYEAKDNLRPDSIFVYRHGRYLIAVWLEQSDFGATGENLRGWSDNPAHKVVHRLVQMIEGLENHL